MEEEGRLDCSIRSYADFIKSNRKDLGSNPTRYSAGLRDPCLLRAPSDLQVKIIKIGLTLV